ncbi:MAG: hypothetical protein ACXVI2_15325, partial [Ilumatobacteraceae bacterium]
AVSFGIAFQNELHLWSTLILIPFCCLQLVRSVYEEQLLGATFPEYADYARHTGRLVPFVN